MIEELEVSQDVVAQARAVLAQRIEGIYVDRKQIDLAWEWATDPADPHDEKCLMCIQDALAMVGIVRCEGCGGSGKVVVPLGYPNQQESDTCPDCAKFTGHGWVLKGEGDGMDND